MSVHDCPFCHYSLESRASECPNCGRALDDYPRQETRSTKAESIRTMPTGRMISLLLEESTFRSGEAGCITLRIQNDAARPLKNIRCTLESRSIPLIDTHQDVNQLDSECEIEVDFEFANDIPSSSVGLPVITRIQCLDEQSNISYYRTRFKIKVLQPNNHAGGGGQHVHYHKTVTGKYVYSHERDAEIQDTPMGSHTNGCKSLQETESRWIVLILQEDSQLAQKASAIADEVHALLKSSSTAELARAESGIARLSELVAVHPEIPKLREALESARELSPDGACISSAKEQPASFSQPTAGTDRMLEILPGVMVPFRWIPPGSFHMGSPHNELGRECTEFDPHLVQLPKGFWLAEHPTTQDEWKGVMHNEPAHFSGRGNYPIECVSWDDVQDFIDCLGTRGYRLPTEMEWEYACRAGGQFPFYFGTDIKALPQYAWFQSNSENGTRPVAEKKPSMWGLYDMHGNVMEWLHDDWEDPGSSLRSSCPVGIARQRGGKVIRGGCWRGPACMCRCAARSWVDRVYRGYEVGFRLLFQNAT